VTFAGDEDSAPLATAHGLEFTPLQADEFDGFIRDDRRTSLVARWRDRPARLDRARAAFGTDSFTAALRRIAPDLVLINGEMHAHIMSTFAAGVPMALLNSFVSIWRVPEVPPPHHAARPGVGWRGSTLGMELLWQNLRLRKLRRRWLARVRDAGCDRVSVLHELAQVSGLDPRDLDDRQWLIPFTYRRFPVLSLHAREFEFPQRPPAHVHYVGPMILASRPDRMMDEADRYRLDPLLADRRDGASGRRLIYAGFGSALTTDLSFLHRLVRIVEGRPGWDLVLSLSGGIEPQALGPLPRGVHVFRWLPQTEVLASAEAAITHGGISTIDECVANGVPMVVYSGGETDMNGTLSRVVYHGLGFEGHRRDETDTIRQRVDQLLAAQSVRARVSRFREIYARYVRDRVAERTVEALLSTARPRPGRYP
jgi:zeaxanthin glucosyltransferase